MFIPRRLSILLLPMIMLLIVLPFPGTIAARLLFLLLSLGAALSLCNRTPGLCDGFPPGRWSIGIWISVCSLSFFYSVDPQYTLKELQNEIIYSMAVFFSFFVAARQPRPALMLIRSLAMGMLFIGSIAAYYWFKNGGLWVEEGLQGGTGSFATYIVTCAPAIFWLALEDSSTAWRRFSLALLIFALFLAVITTQRAIWLGLAAESIVAIYLLRQNGHIQMSARKLWASFFAVLCLGVFALALANRMRGHESIASLIPSDATINLPIAEQNGGDGDSRIPFWPAIAKTIVHHPMIGSGFGIESMKKAYPELLPPKYPLLWHAHNMILNAAIQLGLPGGLALLAMFYGLGRYFWLAQRARPNIATACIAGLMLLVGVLLRNQVNDFFRRDMALLFWCLMGVFSAMATPINTDGPHA